jgi:ectoine hydroxylase-related dioxygenase (phytanoyl-CoA dioxygenase family)
MSVLTPQEIARFHRDGYLPFRRVIDDATVQNLRDSLQRVMQDELSREEASDRPPEFAYGHDRKATATIERPARAIHQFVNMWKISPEYRAVLDNPLIVGAIRELMGVEHIRLWHDQVISKPPGDNGHFACHHDYYFWPLDRPTMISCWLALDDATPANGCMHVVPGSHRDPRFQPADCDLAEDIHLLPSALGPGEPASLYADVRTWRPERAVPVPLKAGECMFHHCLNYHMTPQNMTDRQRRAFVMIFMPDGTRYRHAQSPNHVCTNYLGLEDGQVLDGETFPLCGE